MLVKHNYLTARWLKLYSFLVFRIWVFPGLIFVSDIILAKQCQVLSKGWLEQKEGQIWSYYWHWVARPKKYFQQIMFCLFVCLFILTQHISHVYKTMHGYILKSQWWSDSMRWNWAKPNISYITCIQEQFMDIIDLPIRI